jgi:hypothetical protein
MTAVCHSATTIITKKSSINHPGHGYPLQYSTDNLAVSGIIRKGVNLVNRREQPALPPQFFND